MFVYDFYPADMQRCTNVENTLIMVDDVEQQQKTLYDVEKNTLKPN